MPNPSKVDFGYQIGPHTVYVIGDQVHFSNDTDISRAQAMALGADQNLIAQAMVARGSGDSGFMGVYPAYYKELMLADGILLTEPSSAACIQTADCAAIVLLDRKTHHAVLMHAGRAGLSGEGNCPSCSVVINGVKALCDAGGKVEDIEALVVGTICGHCFVHNDPGAEKYVERFRRYTPSVFADEEAGALDLYRVIVAQLRHEGVPEGSIRHEGPCTRETPALSSYRRDRDKKNTNRNTFCLVRG